MRIPTAALLGLCAATSLACHHTPPPSGSPVAATPSGRLEGTVTYRSRIALPPGSVVRVTLGDTAAGGMRWTQVIATTGENVPVPFSIPFDAALTRPDSTYFAIASIQSGGRITFASPVWVPALGPGAPASLELVLRIPDPLVGAWTRPVPSQESRTEGIELTPQGSLVLINICSMRGVSWNRSGDTLELATNTERYPDPLILRTTISQVDDTGLVIEKGGGYFVGRWHRRPLDRPLHDDCPR
jgi:putative lipoprotein